MKKVYLFTALCFLGLLVFSAPAYACRRGPRITHAYADLEKGILYIYGDHFNRKLRVTLGGQRLTLVEDETNHEQIAALIPEEFQKGGTFRLVVSKRIRRYWRRHWKKAQMDITIEGAALKHNPGNPGTQDPAGGTGDTTAPTIIPQAPASVGFTESSVLVDLVIQDDHEVGFYAIQDGLSPTKTVYAEPGLTNWEFSLQLEPTHGPNSYLVVASDTSGNISKAVVEIEREKSCQGCDLSGMDLSGTDLSGADLSGAEMTGIQLVGANLNQANLSGANLRAATLNDATLVEANLRSAVLSSARLYSADLTGADLSSANLVSARLYSADLTGADLTGADLTNAVLSSVVWGNTTCPDGTNSDLDDGDGFSCLNNP